MNGFTFKTWRAVGVAATLSLAACGGEAGSGGEAGGESGEGGGEGGEAAVTAPAQAGGGEGGEGGGESGGEGGEAGAASAYAGVSGEQLTALRIEHLKGFVMAAERVLGENQTAEAGVLVQQGLLEVYDIAPDQFGSLNVEIIRAATDGSLDRTQLTQRVSAAEAELDRALGALSDVDHAALAARMVDIATGLYQNVNQADYVDTIEYQHSMGAAYAARSALTLGRTDLRAENQRAYTEAESELNRFVGLWATPVAPEQPPAYRDVLAQGSRVRLALSPYL
jgi:hypothetical protein